jgi:hypothetical protein
MINKKEIRAVMEKSSENMWLSVNRTNSDNENKFCQNSNKQDCV